MVRRSDRHAIVCPACRGGGRIQLSEGEGACCDECDGEGRIGDVLQQVVAARARPDIKQLQQALLDLRRGDGT